jgi:L-ascorbate 6-phosphate lactonase
VAATSPVIPPSTTAIHPLEFWWIGQAGFRLRDTVSGTTVFCDPYLTRNDARAWQAPIDDAALADSDIVVCSHEHGDHLDRPTLLAAAARPGSRFISVVPRPLADQRLGPPRSRVVAAQPGELIERAGVKIHPVRARHGVDVKDAYTFGQELSGGLVRYLGYVVEIGGVRVYHAGDCAPYPGQLDDVRALHPHVALLPINGRDFYRETDFNIVGNMDHREAARLANDLGVEVMVPMHWEMFAANRGYPGDLLAYVTHTFPTMSVMVPGRGARFIFQPTAAT